MTSGDLLFVVACCSVVTVTYTASSWMAADGLPLFRDWHYWAGLPLVLAIGFGMAWVGIALAEGSLS